MWCVKAVSSFHLIFSGGQLAHLAYSVHKTGLQTKVLNVSTTRNIIMLHQFKVQIEIHLFSIIVYLE